MAPFKDEINAATVAALGAAVARELPAFDRARFEAAALDGLEDLELKARIARVAEALHRALGTEFASAAPAVARAAAGLGSMWEAWPAQQWVETHGLEHPEIALDAIGAMTAAASGESAVRPYLDRHPELAWARVRAWAADADVHLRRLASEGTRPRLPWAAQVRSLLRDPAPGLALIGSLREDPEEYVRRSVANHLNDVARDHPDAALDAAAAWREAGGQHVERVLRHGLRGLVKKGDPRALALVGADVGAPVRVDRLDVAPRVTIGDVLRFCAAVTSEAAEPVNVAVDYAIHYVGARGARKAPKVFKGATRRLGPGETWVLERAHPMRHVSVRRLHPGAHRLDVQVNGVVLAGAEFELTGG